MAKVTDVSIVAERRPGLLERTIKVRLEDGWDWNGRVELSSTDGYVAVFTKSETAKTKVAKAQQAVKAQPAPPI